MWMKRVGGLALAALFACAGSGCKKAEAPPVAKPPPPPALETIARAHWVGKKHLVEDPNATNIIALWNLPEAAKLQATTLDKLASAPYRLSTMFTKADTNVVSSMLRPLLEDLLESECWVEVAQRTNEPPELGLALRLPEERASLWQSNLASGLEALTGTACARGTNGWTFKHLLPPTSIELIRERDWTLVLLSPGQSALRPGLLAAIERSGSPFAPTQTNAWLEADLDLPGFVRALVPGAVPAQLPRVSLAVTGDGENVRPAGELTFQAPLNLNLEPWQVPTNLIQQPLIGFSALRGIGPWLSQQPLWRNLQTNPPPSQAFLWTLSGLPFLTYGVLPVSNASSAFAQFAQDLVRDANPWLKTNAFGRLDVSTNADEVSWVNVPVVNPYARLLKTNDSEYVLAGLVPPLPILRPFPEELLTELGRHTNLVWYDWELTGSRMESVLAVSQILRFCLRRPQLDTDCPVMELFKVIAPSLGNCATAVTQTEPTRIAFKRKSTIGLSSIELHILADWLESPDFPLGFYTTRMTNAPLMKGPKIGPLPPRKAPRINALPERP